MCFPQHSEGGFCPKRSHHLITWGLSAKMPVTPKLISETSLAHWQSLAWC